MPKCLVDKISKVREGRPLTLCDEDVICGGRVQYTAFNPIPERALRSFQKWSIINKTGKTYQQIMDRRGFIRNTIISMSSLATLSLLEKPLMAYGVDMTEADKTESKMKRIIIIDGGPRRNMNTAKMLHKFAEGVESVNKDIEVKILRLYELDYKGCMSCMACKLKGRASNVCRFKDSLSPVLDEIAQADGLVLGSPIYFGEVTGQMRAFLERLSFPWLSYNDYSMTAPKQMPVVLIETLNGMPEKNNSNGFGSMEFCITKALGKPQRIVAYNTCQVKDYSRYELAGFSEEAKHQWRDAHWEDDLQNAFEAGRQMAMA